MDKKLYEEIEKIKERLSKEVRLIVHYPQSNASIKVKNNLSRAACVAIDQVKLLIKNVDQMEGEK